MNTRTHGKLLQGLLKVEMIKEELKKENQKKRNPNGKYLKLPVDESSKAMLDYLNAVRAFSRRA